MINHIIKVSRETYTYLKILSSRLGGDVTATLSMILSHYIDTKRDDLERCPIGSALLTFEKRLSEEFLNEFEMEEMVDES